MVGEEETDSGAETATSPGIEETGQVRPEPQVLSQSTHRTAVQNDTYPQCIMGNPVGH